MTEKTNKTVDGYLSKKKKNWETKKNIRSLTLDGVEISYWIQGGKPEVSISEFGEPRKRCANGNRSSCRRNVP